MFFFFVQADSYKRKYTIQRYYQSQDSTIPLDLPENFTNKEEALKAFIGQRKFHNISIETFNFQGKIKITHFNNNNNNNNTFLKRILV